MDPRQLDTRTVCRDFEEWATGLSGIPGGNPQAELWFCGIEYSGNSESVELDEPDMDKELSEYPFWTDGFKEKYKCKDKYTTWPFNQKQAKIAFAYSNEGGLSGWQDFMHDEFYTHDGHTFGMNLYPLGFRNIDGNRWTRGHYLKTGFLSKEEYAGWCSQHRFPRLRNLVVEFSPKALVCSGVGFRRDFLIAFADGVDQVFESDSFQTLVVDQHRSSKSVEWTYINDGKTLLVITPFLGQGGLMSDASLIDLGNFIRRQVGV